MLAHELKTKPPQLPREAWVVGRFQQTRAAASQTTGTAETRGREGTPRSLLQKRNPQPYELRSLTATQLANWGPPGRTATTKKSPRAAQLATLHGSLRPPRLRVSAVAVLPRPTLPNSAPFLAEVLSLPLLHVRVVLLQRLGERVRSVVPADEVQIRHGRRPDRRLERGLAG
jgi:hypothetical protein